MARRERPSFCTVGPSTALIEALRPQGCARGTLISRSAWASSRRFPAGDRSSIVASPVSQSTVRDISVQSCINYDPAWEIRPSSYQSDPRQELRERKAEQEQAGTRRKRGYRKGQAGLSCKAGPRAPKYREQATARTSLSPQGPANAPSSAPLTRRLRPSIEIRKRSREAACFEPREAKPCDRGLSAWLSRSWSSW
jgi:hypothetical protein